MNEEFQLLGNSPGTGAHAGARHVSNTAEHLKYSSHAGESAHEERGRTRGRSIVRTAIMCVLAFIIPIVVVLVLFYVLSVYPFGDHSLIVWDYQISYTYFFEWFRNVLHGDLGLVYSFSKSLGGNMFALYSTICASPICLLLYFFNGDNPVAFATLAAVLNFGFAGLTSYIYVHNRFKLEWGMELALSTSYALMMYMATQIDNPMWLDGVVMLPLVMLGIYRVVRDGKPVMLFVTILVAILIDWYNGYMICLFSILFYLVESAIYAPTARKEGRRVWLGILVNPGRFAVAYALGVVASLIVLYPTALQLLNGKGSPSTDLLSPGFKWKDAFPLLSAFPGVWVRESSPQIYTGVFVLLCCFWFFFSGKVSVRAKVATGLLLAFMIFSTAWLPLDRIWCGFRDALSFYCRYAFLISGLMVFMSGFVLEHLHESSKIPILISGAVVVAGCVFVAFSGRAFSLQDFDNYFIPMVGACFTAAMTILLCIMSSVNGKVILIVVQVVLVVMVCVEMSIPTAANFCHEFTYLYYGETNSRYEQYYSEGREQYDELDSEDGTDVNAYRFCKLYNFMSPYKRPLVSNESLVYGYSQIAIYDSTYDDALQNLFSALGYCKNWSCIISYNYPILPTDSIFGVKYVSAGECPYGFVETDVEATQDGNRVYENPYALPLGFTVDPGAVGDNLTLSTDDMGNDGSFNPFENQNKFVSELMGEDVELFKKLDVRQVERLHEGFKWEVDVPQDSPVYGFLSTETFLDANLVVDGKTYYDYSNRFFNGVFPVSDVDKWETTEIELLPIQPEPGSKDYGKVRNLSLRSTEQMYVYALDTDVLQEVVDELGRHPFEVDEFEEGYVHGTCSTDSDGIMFTSIPYDEGWTVEVNGNEVQPQKVEGALMAIPVSEGENDIEMTYHLPGFKAGAAATVVSIVLFVAFMFVIRRRDERSTLPESWRKAVDDTLSWEADAQERENEWESGPKHLASGIGGNEPGHDNKPGHFRT
ncbi:MAG: YfhO family protein [Coriobacteriales bacterium]|jgi:uncharacterized membrane protein YfhO